ncbi:MAG: hypothetical protein AMJ81_01550 [Phycisphaerae bacterium SM23_33]|nr:MAG: hypothetical protein AMJ81_01550 [Phycisphaerae bacterium SM23_33]
MFSRNFGVGQVPVQRLGTIESLVLLAAVAMAIVIQPADSVRATCRCLVEAAVLDSGQPIRHAFCRFAAGLRDPITAEPLQAHVVDTGCGLIRSLSALTAFPRGAILCHKV